MSSLKASAIAHSNIAFIKYWGRDKNHPKELNIPLNDNVSMTKEGIGRIKLQTHTTIEFSDVFSKDTAILEGREITGRGMERILSVVDSLRNLAGIKYFFRLESRNDFPTSAGLASSAAGFAALALATSNALKPDLTLDEISTYARLGSGSASRSLHGGFVYWHKGDSHETSVAEQICSKGCLDIRAVIAVISTEEKKIKSDQGHEYADTSIYNQPRIDESIKDAKIIKDAIIRNDFSAAGKIIEKSCNLMHAVMMTSESPLFYWEPGTIKVIKAVHEARDNGFECYYTIDAGPNVHVLSKPRDMEKVKEMLENIPEVQKTICVKPSKDSHVVDEHLF